MLTAAWLVKGTACGWGFLRSASPGRPVRATVAAATRLRGGARRGDSSVALTASLSDRAALPFPSSLCTEHSHRLRLRPHGRERLPSASTSRWGPSFCCCPRGAREPHRSHGSDDNTPGRPAGSLEQGAGRAKSCGAAELYENPWTIPNLLSMARIGLAPVLGYLIVEEDFNIALGVFALAGVTDLVSLVI
ncbi:hypothetical protein lerEdw1_019299 [Lerista edwardsae]|nr:hypothetical protein lerEdw1_019299 [Lerista edwardsae]